MTSKQSKTDHTKKGFIADPIIQGQSDIGPLIEPYRRELQLHCYRMLGSLHDAEDVVQETMLRAWKHFDTFTNKGPGSLRAWLYTIATNASLDALKKHTPRTMPTVSYPMADPLKPIGLRMTEVAWLEPIPDTWMAEAIENPEARYTRAESVSLAFLTALQLLPPRQRAILILSDVLDWRASEIAQLLESSISGVNSALHRARTTLEKHYQSNVRETAQLRHDDEATNALLSRYLRAWEMDDISGLVTLLKEDAIMSMPPIPSWYQGHDAILRLLRTTILPPHIRNKFRLYPTRANGQPAFISYRIDEAGHYTAHGVQVITFDDAHHPRAIASITSFLEPSLVPLFGFPPQLPDSWRRE